MEQLWDHIPLHNKQKLQEVRKLVQNRENVHHSLISDGFTGFRVTQQIMDVFPQANQVGMTGQAFIVSAP